MDNGISDVGAQSLAAAIEVNTSLQVLDLAKNRISDIGAMALGIALRFKETALYSLCLQNNEVSAAVMEDITLLLRGTTTTAQTQGKGMIVCTF